MFSQPHINDSKFRYFNTKNITVHFQNVSNICRAEGRYGKYYVNKII